MPDPADYDLRPTDPPAEPAPPVRAYSPWPWIIGIAAAAAILMVGVFFMWRAPTEPRVAEAPAAAPEPLRANEVASNDTTDSLGAPAEPIYLPPLGEADHVVRPLVSALSSHPRVLRLLATEGLVRRFTVSVENIAAGQTPAAHLQTIRPAGAYQFIDEEDVVLADPRGYRRYDELANAFASVDAREAARLYTMLKPRIEEAYRELGRVEPFDRAFERAVDALLEVPRLEGDVLLEPKGALFRYADPGLEALTPAQKQMLRMGPRNVRLVQAKLREIAQELGVPEGRLPVRR
jgi:hypothetical protein